MWETHREIMKQPGVREVHLFMPLMGLAGFLEKRKKLNVLRS